MVKTSVEEKKDSKVKEFTLPNIKLKLKPIKKAKGKNGEIHIKHEANFLFGHAKNGFSPKIYDKGNLVNPLTREEQRFFENPDKSGLSFMPGDLAVTKKQDNYWKSPEARVRLSEETLILDLSLPLDYLKYKSLLTHKNLFAKKPEHLEHGNPNWRKEYLYVFEPMDYQMNKRAKDYVDEAELYRYMFKIENDKDAMVNMLTLLKPKHRVSPNSTLKFLTGELNSYLKNSPKMFSKIMKDNDLEIKAIIKRSLDKGAISVEGTVHKLPTGDVIGENRNEAIAFLKDPGNQKTLDLLKVKIDS